MRAWSLNERHKYEHGGDSHGIFSSGGLVNMYNASRGLLALLVRVAAGSAK